MRIAQITDTHLSSQEDSFPQLDPWTRMQLVLDVLLQEDIDCLIHTGDICLDKPRRSIYELYRERIDAFECPVLHIPGNHDRGDLMKEVLPNAYTTMHITEKEGFTIIFLNTGDAHIEKEELHKLKGLTEMSDKPLIIFMHHPPLYAGVRHMDKNYPLKNIHEVWPILQATKVPIEVFCGHYHTQRSIKVKNVQVHITPSTLYNIDPAFEEIKRDYKTPPAYRWIRIEDGKMHQGLSFIGGEST